MKRARKLVAGLTLAGMVTFGVVVVSAPAEAHNRVCKTVSVPKTEPWYKCIRTSPAQRLLPGCYVQSKVVCS